MKALIHLGLILILMGCTSRIADPHTDAVGGVCAAAISVQVEGEVRNPQVLTLAYGSKVLDAIREAGGFTDFARRRRIQVKRAGEIYVVDSIKVSKGTKPDLLLKNGDRITVPTAGIIE